MTKPLMTVQITYQDNKIKTLANIDTIDHISSPIDYLIYGTSGGIFVKKDDIKEIIFVPQTPEVEAEEVMKAEDA